MRKINKIIALCMASFVVLGLSSCKISLKTQTFKEKCKMTEDGFEYYKDKDIGICIISLPKGKEEVVIPQYIEGEEVKQIGYLDTGLMYRREYYVELGDVKHMTIQHYFETPYVYGWSGLASLTYVDWPFWEPSNEFSGTAVRFWAGYKEEITTVVRLKTSGKIFNVKKFPFKTIYLEEFVKEIDKGVFFGLSDVTIETAYDSKPDGWQDGWNGNCEVVWGVKFDT